LVVKPAAQSVLDRSLLYTEEMLVPIPGLLPTKHGSKSSIHALAGAHCMASDNLATSSLMN